MLISEINKLIHQINTLCLCEAHMFIFNKHLLSTYLIFGSVLEALECSTMSKATIPVPKNLTLIDT